MPSNMFQDEILCPICRHKVERVGFVARSGLWIGSQVCNVCRYKWLSKAKEQREIIESLRYGGDAGVTRLWPDGIMVGWLVCTGMLKKGQIISFVSPGADAGTMLDELPEGKQVKKWQRRFLHKGGSSLSHNRRYLVKVFRKSRAGKELKPWYYAPVANTLESGEKAVLVGGRSKSD
jgi:hypothetical protein